MSFLTTTQQLKTILDTISSSILPVKFSYQETMPTSFPSANIIFSGGKERMLDTITNEVEERFVVRAIFPVEERQAAMEKWMTLVDEVGTKFAKDDYQTLSGNAISFMVDSYQPPFTSQDYGQAVIVFDMIVVAKSIKYINA